MKIDCARSCNRAVTFFSLEHLKSPLLRRILRHYEFSIPEEPLRWAEEQVKFEKMKEVERSGQFAEPWHNPRNDAVKVR